MTPHILYLIPHAHTDLGYTHDPVIAWELHDHFLDRAIALCEATAEASVHERFYWTIEVFCTLEHWWQRRDNRQRDRLLALMRSGQIDLGRRFTNGTFLNVPLNIEWENNRTTAFCTEHGLTCPSVLQNDVNGMSIRYARELAQRGVNGFMMGLNTTMGVSPEPRPGAFWWDLGEGRRFLVWNGWIYNRIGRWVHLNELSTKLQGAWPDLFGRLPADYPFPFAMMSGTIGDNVGPFVHLPGQVAKFNAQQCGLEVRLATATQFLQAVRSTEGLREYSGDWNDAWLFGGASMPQEVAMLRRAQRRLEVIQGMTETAGVQDPGIDSLVDQAHFEASIACEHTYCSHTSEFEATHGDDGKRQWVESQICFHKAFSFSALALRKTLVEIAGRYSVEKPSVLLVNPTEQEIPMRILWNRRASTHLATSEVLEHLTQLDREPTLEWVLSSPELGIPKIVLPPHSVQVLPLQELGPIETTETDVSNTPAEIASDALSVGVDAQGSLARITLGNESDNWLNRASAWASGVPVEEHPVPSLKFKSEAEKRDPSDAEWNPDLQFDRKPVGKTTRVVRKSSCYGQELAITLENSPVREVNYRIDAFLPEMLQIELLVRIDDVSATRAFYFPLHFNLPGTSDIRFHYDSCGDWTCAVDGQLPGSSTSSYESYRGVAAERDGHCVYVIAPDAPLWQFGGFTYGHPHAKIDRTQATIVSWLYNNYWYTNFPSVTPGLFRLRYLLTFEKGGFDPRRAQQLYNQFNTPFLSHPIWPKQQPA